MNEEITVIRKNLFSVYRLIFGVEFEGDKEVDVVELALFIRNQLKGRFDIPAYHRNRFNLVLQQMGVVDFKLSEKFYSQCG